MLVSFILQTIAGAVTIAGMYVGSTTRRGAWLYLASVVPWFAMTIYDSLWGLVPLNTAVAVCAIVNLMRLTLARAHSCPRTAVVKLWFPYRSWLPRAFTHTTVGEAIYEPWKVKRKWSWPFELIHSSVAHRVPYALYKQMPKGSPRPKPPRFPFP